MNVYVFDNRFFSLQNHIAATTAKQFVYVEGLPKVPEAEFHGVENTKGSITQMLSEDQLLQQFVKDRGQKMMIVSHWEHEFYERVCAYAPDAVVIGSTSRAKLLETDRRYARQVMSNIGQGLRVKVVGQQVFEDRKDALAYVKKTKAFVIKEHPSTKGTGVAVMTVVANSEAMRETVIRELEKPVNRWWPEDGESAGCTVEHYVQGSEIAFSCFFNGKQFIMPVLANVEQKDAQEGDRTGIFTGEVGSTMEPLYLKHGPVLELFTRLTPYLMGQHCGMVDINFILSEGDLWFVEFTIRFGRPTLENQIAMVKGNLAQQMYEACTERRVMKYELGASVTHTLYHYGYPLLQKFDEQDLRNTIDAPRFQLPKSTDVVRFVPFFAQYKAGAWEGVVRDGRYAICTGIAGNIANARKFTLPALAQIKIPQVTWRTDVGLTHDDTMVALMDEGLLHD